MSRFLLFLFACIPMSGWSTPHSNDWDTSPQDPPTYERQVMDANDEAPNQQDHEEAKRKDEAIRKRREAISAALSSPAENESSLHDILTSHPQLAAALKDGNDNAIGELLGRKADHPKIAELKARYLAENNFDQFSRELDAISDQRSPQNNVQRALIKEADRLAAQHKDRIDRFAARTDDDRRDLAVRIGNWDQLIKSEKGKEAAQAMASYYRSIPNRAAFSDSLGRLPTTGQTELDHYIRAAALMSTNAKAKSPTDRLAGGLGFTPQNLSTFRAFTEQYSERSWPEAQSSAQRYNELNRQLISYDSTGRPVVNQKVFSTIKQEFPGLNARWAFAAGDTNALMALGTQADGSFKLDIPTDPSFAGQPRSRSITTNRGMESLRYLTQLTQTGDPVGGIHSALEEHARFEATIGRNAPPATSGSGGIQFTNTSALGLGMTDFNLDEIADAQPTRDLYRYVTTPENQRTDAQTERAARAYDRFAAMYPPRRDARDVAHERFLPPTTVGGPAIFHYSSIGPDGKRRIERHEIYRDGRIYPAKPY